MIDDPHIDAFSHTLEPVVLEQETLAALWHDTDAPPASEDECLTIIDEYFPSNNEHNPAGRGNDCAELVISQADHALALSTDFFWENSHFRASYFTPYEVGAKALTVALSDLAGAGAKPLGYSLGLMLPSSLSTKTLRHILAGMAFVAKEQGVILTGGDLSQGEQLGFCSTVWGASLASDGKTFFSRKQAKPGDTIFLIGSAGLARVGLAMLEEEGRECIGAYPIAVKAHLAPTALLQETKELADIVFTQEEPARISLMDLSDGLARDLPRLLGRYGADLTFSPTAVHNEIYQYAALHNESAEDIFLLGGEDFALLGTCPSDLFPELQHHIQHCTFIGTVLDRPGIHRHDRLFSKEGFDHFTKKDTTKQPVHIASYASVTLSGSNTNFAAQTIPAHTSSLTRTLENERKLSNQSSSIKEASSVSEEFSTWSQVLATKMVSIQHCCKVAWEKNILAGFNGNASVRVPPYPGHQHSHLDCCLITKSGVAKAFLCATDFALLSMPDGKLLQGESPSTEAPTHLAIYAACPETQAILHTHPSHLLALSLLLPKEQRLDMPFFEANAYRTQLCYTEPLSPGSPELASAVATAAKKCKAIWLERHGLVVHGKNLEDVLGLTEELEQLAKIQMLLLKEKS